MIVIPKEKPILENLNSYYLDLSKLCEHFQGEIGSGCIYFKSAATEGIVFFDKDDILNGEVLEKSITTTGKQAVKALFDLGRQKNFSINIYKIEAEKVYFWASISTAKKIYSNLSTEFTDLEGLIKKMGSEKLTGYIDASIGDGDAGGILFFNNGEPVGGSYSWADGKPDDSRESMELLIKKTKEFGGLFHVSRIPAPGKSNISTMSEQAESPFDIMPALEDFLNIFEVCASPGKKSKTEFISLLKRKFVEKAEVFPFLDPFAAEFEYSDKKIYFHGSADKKTLATGLLECCRELAVEMDVMDHLREELAPWLGRYARRFLRLGISF